MARSQKLGEHAPGVLELAWQPGGALLASSGQDGSVRLWDLDAGAGDITPAASLAALASRACLAQRRQGTGIRQRQGRCC